MKFNRLFFLLAFVCCVVIAEQSEETTCSKCADKSAVTKEAKDEAAKVIQNPPVYNTEVYTSKVNSKSWKSSQIDLLKNLNFINIFFIVLKPAPFFSGTAVVNGQFVDLKLSDFFGKYLILLFYPLDFTFVCPTEIIAFSDRVEDFRALNAEIVGISTDSKFTHLAWVNTPRKQGGLGHVNIPLLSDLTHQISKDFGVYLEHLGHSLRGLFIIDGKGIVRQITMNDLPVGRSVDETLRLIQAFQYSDSHGEVCPAGWKKGDPTIIPDPAEKLKYFSTVKD